MPKRFRLDPNDVKDYTIDWSGWLVDGDTLASSTMTADPGITVTDESMTPTKATVWVTGGTAGRAYSVLNHITTTQGREADETITFVVREA